MNARRIPLGGSESLKRPRRGRGFTLIEVLATLMLMAIVLPAIMQGLSLATRAASDAKRRGEAAGLAQSKMSELLSTGSWQNGGLSGDFGSDWPDYHWDAAVNTWANDATGAGMQEIDLHVTWQSHGRPASVTFVSLAYPSNSTGAGL